MAKGLLKNADKTKRREKGKGGRQVQVSGWSIILAKKFSQMAEDPSMTGGVDHGHPARRFLGHGRSSATHFVTYCTCLNFACRNDGHVAGLNLSHPLDPELDRKEKRLGIILCG